MILNGALDRSHIRPQAYDHWLDRRLEHGTNETWLANQLLYSAATFCELIGVAMLHPELSSNTQDNDLVITARAIDFNVTQQGVGAIRSALDDVSNSAGGARGEPSGAFGQLFTQLSRAYRDEEDFALFRDILQSCIFDTWPIAKVFDVLGQSFSERRLHSVSTASAEFGIGKKLLTDISNLVGPIEIRKEIGATRNQFHSLVKDPIIGPMIDLPTIQSPWRSADGTTLVAALTAFAMVVRVGDKNGSRSREPKNDLESASGK